MLTRWQTELGRLVNGEADFSEDEGIFSPEVASSCSSRDTGLGSIAELLSDDDHTSVISESPELNTSSGKDQSGKTLVNLLVYEIFKGFITSHPVTSLWV
jgi:hypothetical protein